VKGIEPSSLGWEPRALPLSYTRADESPIGEVRIPGGWYIPHGGRTITDPLAIGHPLEVSPLSRGKIFSAPIRAHFKLGIRLFPAPPIPPPLVLRLRRLTKQHHNRPHAVLDWAYHTYRLCKRGRLRRGAAMRERQKKSGSLSAPASARPDSCVLRSGSPRPAGRYVR
jgi:hypothetical protein